MINTYEMECGDSLTITSDAKERGYVVITVTPDGWSVQTVPAEEEQPLIMELVEVRAPGEKTILFRKPEPEKPILGKDKNKQDIHEGDHVEVAVYGPGPGDETQKPEGTYFGTVQGETTDGYIVKPDDLFEAWGIIAEASPDDTPVEVLKVAANYDGVTHWIQEEEIKVLQEQGS